MIDENSPIKIRFEHLVKVISSERFLQLQGLVNEVPFFICPYKPDEEVAMKRLIKQLTQLLSQRGISLLQINLYDLCIELLQKRGIFERIIKQENLYSKDELKELLQGVLDPEKHLTPAIANIMGQTDFQVMFLTGAGEVFPYVRSHNILNNLQSTAKDKPTVLFFPGTYTHSIEGGASLDLFGRLHDDKYYRAFNIYHVQT